jgi:nucleoside-diphosphate-sugar epimerase
MSNGLIGYTGFVGSNLLRQTEFHNLYNSRNITEIEGQKFDYLVCAGAPAVKWLANKEPEKDRENLLNLMTCLETVKAEKLVLISTVDVYPIPLGVDEDTPIDLAQCQPYGKHRLELENFIAEHFNSLIVRLLGLFGEGIKKNIIYDFLHNNIGGWIHKDSVFQFYNLANLWQNIQIALRQNISVVNFAVEPVSVEEVAREAFGFAFTNTPEQTPVKYDMRTKYYSSFQGLDLGYLYTREQTLLEIKHFVNNYQGK